METIIPILFWGCFGLLFYIYLGYLFILKILGVFVRARHSVAENEYPAITICFAARNERVSIEKKIETIRALNYPKEKIQILAASDASTDGTFEFLDGQPDVTAIQLETQGGKNAALNALLPLAAGDILFFTDANTILHPDALKTVARHFHDPRTGAVFGELIYTQDETWNAVGRGTSLYWRYENCIKRSESRLGSLLVGGGSLLAVRRELVAPLDPRIANDFEIPTRIGAMGYAVLYEPQCLGFEKPHVQIGEELRRTSRIVARGLRGFISLLPVIVKSPLRFWQFLSHKFLRWLTLPLTVIMTAAAWVLRAQPFPGTMLYLAVIGSIGALLGLFLLPISHRSRWVRPFTLLAHLLVMHTAATLGLCQALIGRTPAAWAIPESTRESQR